jgi:hypothetical protein
MSVRVILNSINGQLIVTGRFFSWAEKNNEIKKSETYTGVIITTTLEMKFGGNAFTYINNLNDEYDVAAECTALIQNYDDLNEWVDDFEGYLDFKTIPQDNEGGNTVTISAYSSQLADKLLERHEIDVPYDRLETLDGDTITPFTDEYIEVDVIGTEIISTNVSTIQDSIEVSDNLLFPSIINSNAQPNWRSTILTFEDGLIIPGPGEFEAPNEEWVSARQYFVADKLQGNIKATINIKFETFQTATCIFRVLDFKTLEADIVAERTGVASAGSGNVVETTIELDYDFDTATRLVIICTTSQSFKYIYTTESNYTLISIADPTPCNFVPPIQALNRTANGITGEANVVKSDLFDLSTKSLQSLSWLTNGRLMRQMPIGYVQTGDDKVSQLSFSFKKLYENLDRQFNIGAGVYYDSDESRYKIRIEEKAYFFQDTVILEIPKSAIEEDSYRRDRDLDFYYNEIESGYKYEKLEQVGGLNEYNSTLNHSTPVINDNKLDLLMDYVGSGFVIEDARRSVYENSETEDNKYDSNNIIFNVYDTGDSYIQRTIEGFDSITGIDGITSPINLELTGKRSFFRWGWWMNTGFRGYSDGIIKYNTSEITTKLATQLSTEGYVVKENEDTPIYLLEKSKFSGFIITFNAPLGSVAYKLLEENPYMLIKHWDFFTNDWKFSWIRRASNQPSDKSTNFELIESLNIVDGDGFRILADGGYRLLDDGGIRKII